MDLWWAVNETGVFCRIAQNIITYVLSHEIICAILVRMHK